MPSEIPDDSDAAILKELTALRSELYRMQSAILKYFVAFRNGNWSPARDEAVWREILGDTAPAFPWETIPSEEDLRVQCAHFQCARKGEGIAIEPFAMRQGLPPTQEVEQLQKAIAYLRQIAGSLSLKQGHDLCWENVVALFAARNNTLGHNLTVIDRGPLHSCMKQCNVFARQLYEAVQAHLVSEGRIDE